MIQTMKEMPEAERPYEKCIREGESSLSDSNFLLLFSDVEPEAAVRLRLQMKSSTI